MIKTLLCILLLGIFSCSNKTEEQKRYRGADYGGTDESGFSYEFIFDDGEYCAEVKCYNPNSNTNSTYTLLVNIEDNKLVKLFFPEGGWMDDSHFTPAKPNDDQYFEFTDDRGRKYEVALLEDSEICNSLPD